MFWKALSAVVRTGTAVNAAVAAFGAAAVIAIGVYDFIQSRKKRRF